MDKLGKKVGVIIHRLEGRSEYEALVPIENGTKEMKRIMAEAEKNKTVSPKTNPELKKELDEHFAIWGEKAKDQTAFLKRIETVYGYPVHSQKVLLRGWWAKRTKDATKITGNITSYFTTTRK